MQLSDHLTAAFLYPGSTNFPIVILLYFVRTLFALCSHFLRFFSTKMRAQCEHNANTMRIQFKFDLNQISITIHLEQYWTTLDNIE